MSIYKDVIALGTPIFWDESDLYVLANDASKSLVASYKHASNVRLFRDMAGRDWYFVPFAFDPWFDSRLTPPPPAAHAAICTDLTFGLVSRSAGNT